MSDKKSENLHKEWYIIKFCVKLKKMARKMKQMLDAAYTESDMSRTSVYHWYNESKSSRKKAELLNGLGAPMKVLTGQSTQG